MNLLNSLLLVLQIISALAMIGLILMQHGKGADMGAAFGSGASGSLFGAAGSANFLSRTTAGLATVFLLCTLGLAWFGNATPAAQPSGASVLETALPAAVPGASAAASASGAAAIPTEPAASSAAASAPAVPASGAAQIPGR
ncbi:MAG: preprotein translocase subunit SecG [Burkholderiaceae bacterium]|jgi:preprotein translocase subunit SecG|nr:preprotein translocase subunit SecG [Burkholderiaceae bacterium]